MSVVVRPPETPEAFVEGLSRLMADGARLVSFFASPRGEDTRLLAVVSRGSDLEVHQSLVPGHERRYPSLVPHAPSALWYEREIHDLFGLRPAGHSRRDPLVIALASGAPRPRPGTEQASSASAIDVTPLSLHLRGEGVFTMSYGPVRSGVFESIEYLVETPGEDIPHLGLRVSYKHRGVEARFAGVSIDDGVLLAERVEGVASVAHALAFCSALESIGDVVVPRRAQWLRLLHAELERVANHLDSTCRHAEAAGQAVAYARFSKHKEDVQRLRAELCGSRFGRGVVVPGGVTGPPRLAGADITSALRALATTIHSDMSLLLSTPSFLDRLRGTGVLTESLARRFGALGPLGRASGVDEDVRWTRPYGAYQEAAESPVAERPDADALARQRVRAAEIRQSLSLATRAAAALDDGSSHVEWSIPLGPVTGESLGWVEAPQGELVTWVEVRDGVLGRVKPRSASFHNMALFPMAFPRDILTDFAFIEASFGLSVAGVAS